MDAGLAAIIAASVSTVLGGLLGFVSSFLTNRQSHKQARFLANLPKRTEAIEFVFLVLFKTLSGEEQSQAVWDRYISSCLWLPQNERNVCLSVLKNRKDMHALQNAQKSVLSLLNSLFEEK